MKFILVRVISILIFIIGAYKWGHWKNWKKYYPTMLFFGMGDLIYVSVFHHNPLWKFPTNFLVPSLDELLLIFMVFFPTTIWFLSNYPKKPFAQIVYNAAWIALYMFIEVVDLKLGIIEYHNGWNLWWSLLHNTIQFPLIALHHWNPILSWTIALIFLITIMNIFNMPFVVWK
jgi:hypothetical protein